MQKFSKTKKNRFTKHIIAVFVLLFAISHLPSALHVSAAVTTNKSISSPLNNLGLIGYWTFDGSDTPWTSASAATTIDKSGNGRTGTLTNMSRTNSPVAGKVGQGLLFDGVDDYVNTTLDFFGLTSFTVSQWVYAKSPSQYDTLWGADGSAGGCLNGDGVYFSGATTLNFRAANVGDDAVTVPDIRNKWTHVVSVYNSSIRRVYFDNVLVYNQTGGAATTGDVDFQIGNYNNCIGSVNFDGLIDDVRVYNRAISTNEITQLYKSGSAKVSKSQSNIDSSLVGWWTFDGPDMTPNVRDKSGRGNNGNIVGTTATTTVPGKIGQALQLDVIDDAVNIGDPASLNISGIGTGMTVSAWVKRKQSDLNDLIVGRGASGGAASVESYGLAMTDDSNIRFRISDGTTRFSSVGAVPKDVWTHVVGIYNGASSTILYIDGLQVDTDTDASFTGINTSASNVSIGDDQTGGGEDYTGAIDNVRIYNRALSATEVAQLYKTGIQTVNKSISGGDSLTGLIGHWTFDGPDTTWSSASAGTVIDKSGNGRTGTLTNMDQALTPVSGKIGQALGFNGSSSNEYVSISPQTFIEGLGSMTVSFWIKPMSPSAVDDSLLVNYNNSSNWVFSFSRTSPGGIDFGVRTSANAETSSANGLVNNINWHHIVGVYDGAQIYLYVDGVQSGTPVAQTGTTMDSFGDIKIYSDTTITDDVRIYNRALSSSEITKLYNLGR